MKAQELRELDRAALEERIQELREELMNLRFQREAGQLKNYRRLREARREIARIRTILRERELAGEEG